MILKLLISSVIVVFFLNGCSSTSSFEFKTRGGGFATKESQFEKELNEIFLGIDNSKESIRTVEEKQIYENKIVEKSNSFGSESYFRKSVLERFK
jgi:hypothetical protein